MIGAGSGANMSDSKAKIRLYVDASLGAGQPVSLGEGQSHYLFSVMRLAVGDRLLTFNGQDGEWLAQASQAHKRAETDRKGALADVASCLARFA